jgi:hypothetical protein
MEKKTEILLATLSRNELKAFDKFITFSLKGKSLNVFNYWRTRYSSVTGELIPDTGPHVSRKTLSDFNKQVEKFLIWTNLERNELNNVIYLVRELRKRNVEKYFDQLLNEIKNIRERKTITGFQNILGLGELNFEEYLMYNSRNDEENMMRIAKERTDLMAFASAHTILFGYINKVFLESDKNHLHSSVLTVSDTAKFVEKHRKIYTKYYPNVWSLYLIYKAIEDNFDYKKINTAYEYFNKNEKYFTEEFLQFGFDFILRLFFTKMDIGDHRAVVDFYRVLQNMIKSGAFDRIYHIQPRLYPGFVLVAVNNGDLALADKLITKYSDKVIASLRVQVSRISMGILELARENYDNVRKLLEGEKPRDSMLNIFCKTTLIKAYFEKGDFRNIYPLSDTLKHFLKRRKDISPTQSNVIKFLNYTSKLAQVKKKNGAGLEYIEAELSKEKYFFQKYWIIQKFNEIKSAS